jgi:hypothetical protein
VEEAFPPRSVRRWGRRSQASGEGPLVHRIDVIDVEDHSPPHRIWRHPRFVCLQVQIAAARPEAAEGAPPAAVEQVEPKPFVEGDRRGHIRRRQRDRTDRLDPLVTIVHQPIVPRDRDCENCQIHTTSSQSEAATYRWLGVRTPTSGNPDSKVVTGARLRG